MNAGTSIAATSTTGQRVALAHRGLCVARAGSSIGQLMATMLGDRSAPGLGQQNCYLSSKQMLRRICCELRYEMSYSEASTVPWVERPFCPEVVVCKATQHHRFAKFRTA